MSTHVSSQSIIGAQWFIYQAFSSQTHISCAFKVHDMVHLPVHCCTIWFIFFTRSNVQIAHNWCKMGCPSRRGSLMKPPRTFISYSHDSRRHEKRVLRLANRLRSQGVDAILDQYEPVPREGWTLWTEKQIRDADWVLVCCTETYLRRVRREEDPGVGLGVCWEANIIYQHLYHDAARNQKFLPIVFEQADLSFIPLPLSGFTRFNIGSSSGYEALYRQITNQPRTIIPPLGKRWNLRGRIE
jgi:hypothetical protein